MVRDRRGKQRTTLPAQRRGDEHLIELPSMLPVEKIYKLQRVLIFWLKSFSIFDTTVPCGNTIRNMNNIVENMVISIEILHCDYGFINIRDRLDNHLFCEWNGKE